MEVENHMLHVAKQLAGKCIRGDGSCIQITNQWLQSRVLITDRTGQPGPVPVYRSGLAGNRSVPLEFKFRSSTDSYRYTGRFDRFTGRFDR